MKNGRWFIAVTLAFACLSGLAPQPAAVAAPFEEEPPPPEEQQPLEEGQMPPPQEYAAPPPAPAVAVDEATIYPTMPPPDPIPEIRPPAPAWGYVWIDGYWDWTGLDWTWNGGYWVPQRTGVVYVAPRFVFIDGRPVYYRSYWAGPGGRREYGYGPRGAPPAAWRARPTAAPGAWRAEHNAGWRSSPGAARYRGPVGRAEPARGGTRAGEPRGNFQRANQPANGNFHPDRANANVQRTGQPAGGNFQHPGQPAAANPYHAGGQPPTGAANRMGAGSAGPPPGAANRMGAPPAGGARAPSPASAPRPAPAPSHPVPSGGFHKR